jgi:alpha-beta hydrolase superfamily lysophospholipase
MEAKLHYLERLEFKIPYYTWDVEQITSVLVFLHGLKSHSGWFLEVGSSLGEKGIKVYAFDRRGSEESECERGHIDHYHLWLEDIYCIIQLAKNENPLLRPHLLGHCFGAKLALGFALRYPKEIQSLVLISPPQGSLKANITLLEKLKVFLSCLFRKRLDVKVPIRDNMFTRDPEKYKFIQKDKLKLERMTTRFCIEVFKLDALINKQFTRLSLPILVLLAKEDRVVDNLKIQRKFFARLRTLRKDLEVFDCMHDLFFEPHHEKVINRIVEWMTP